MKQPPPGVETTPTSTNRVYLREAARRLNRDHRTVKNMIINGTLRGGAEPHPQRLRWYVYTDQLPADTGPDTPAPAPTLVSTSSPAPLPPDVLAQLADQAAEIVTLKHSNRVLTAAVGDLLDALEHYKAGAQSALATAGHFERAADGFSATVGHYREVIAQLSTPGTAADLFPSDGA